jgi:hypothetical protein
MVNCPHQRVSQARAKSKKVENNFGAKKTKKNGAFQGVDATGFIPAEVHHLPRKTRATSRKPPGLSEWEPHL